MSDKIVVSEDGLGTVTIEPEKDVSTHQKMALKALGIMMLMSMERDEDEVKFRNFLKIVKEATTKSRNLYSEEMVNECSAVSEF